MCWVRLSVTSLLAVMAMLLTSSPSLCDLQGPTVAVDLETSPVPDISTIDSVYSGDADVVYAFLVVDDMPGGYVSGYDLGLELTSSDSSVNNLGFHLMPGWASLDPKDRVFPDSMGLPGKPTPTPIGFWTLELTEQCESRARLELGPNSSNSSSDIILLDRGGKPVTACGEFSAFVLGYKDLHPDTARAVLQRSHTDPFHYDTSREWTGAYVPGEAIVWFEPGVVVLLPGQNSGGIDAIHDIGLRGVAQSLGVSGIRRLYMNAAPGGREVVSRRGERVRLTDVWDVYVVTFLSSTNMRAAIDSFSALPVCIYAEPNFLMTPTLAEPNDAYWGVQHLDAIGMPEAWEKSYGDESVRIGILDSGIDYAHPDFSTDSGAGHKVVDGWDFVAGNDEIMDESEKSHGTRSAGIAAAVTNNDSIGIAGVAGGWYPNGTGCSLVALKCREPDGWPLSAVCNAIRDAGPEYGVSVLNCSSIMTDYSADLHTAVCDAHKAGVVIVASKGDSGHSQNVFPADFNPDWVICVGASCYRPVWQRAHKENGCYFTSNYGWRLDMLAPGYKVWSTVADSAYDDGFGTSLATPHSSGVAALVCSEWSTLLPEEVEGLMSASCHDITRDYEGGDDLYGRDDWSGWGMLDADSTLRFLQEPYVTSCWLEDGGYEHSHTGFLNYFIVANEPIPGRHLTTTGYYIVKRYEVRCNANWGNLYEEFHSVWGVGYGSYSTGWAPEDPNHQIASCRVVPGTVTSAGCQLVSYVYEVWTIGLEYKGWFPCRPEEVKFACLLLGGTAASSVSDQHERTPLHGHAETVRVRPNPMTGETRIMLETGSVRDAAVSIYNVSGIQVRSLFTGALPEGFHGIEWNGKGDSGDLLPPGVYFCKVRLEGREITAKVVLTR